MLILHLEFVCFMMRLIADAGSTKITWVLQVQGQEKLRCETPRFNPNYPELSVLENMVSRLPDIPAGVETVEYYGTGYGAEANRKNIEKVLRHHFPQARIEVDTDIMGAARALFGNQPGIACILGTGANSCLYDGHAIVNQAVSLGYLVGDEGSGCYIGRKLARSYFYGFMPEDLRASFQQEYSLDLPGFINQVYHQPEASKYLAGFTCFAGLHQSHPFIQQLVSTCFDEFVEAFILRYEPCHLLPVGFVGSVAWHFQDLLRNVMEGHSLRLETVLKSPL